MSVELGFVPDALGQLQVPCADDACRAALAQLPSCYSQSFYGCADAIRQAVDVTHEQNPKLPSGCQQYWDLRKQNPAAFDHAVDAMNFCPEPQPSKALGLGIGGFVIGGILGLGVGMLIGTALGG